MLRVKDSVEWSDEGYVYWDTKCPIKDVIGDETYVMLYGNEVVQPIFQKPLETVVGCTTTLDGVTYRANYKYSEICKREGRAKAFHLIEDNSPVVFLPTEPKVLTEASEIGSTVAFDIETGGTSGIRCISFYDGLESFYVDCRGLKSDKKLKSLLTELFTSDRRWIAHYGVHDIGTICDKLKIPLFPLFIDTMWFERDVEFRKLRYLSGVYLGVPAYKHQLEEANSTLDFKLLVEYCCKDSMYTWYLATRLNILPMETLNQVIYTMRNTTLGPDNRLFEVYPELTGLSKKELRTKLTYVKPTDIPLLKAAVNPTQPVITYHGLEGLKVELPRAPEGTFYLKSYSDNIMDIMAQDIRYDSPELSAYRYQHNIEPIRHYWHTECEKPYLVNWVCCVTTEPTEGFIHVSGTDLMKLF